jgi:protocatechuate 3,4-dioxygenase, beta subunit
MAEAHVAGALAPGALVPPPAAGVDPPLLFPGYRATVRRAPLAAPLPLPLGPLELGAPVLGERDPAPGEADLTAHHASEPIGERIIVSGRVVDGDGRGVAGALVEVWQANAAGRYVHVADRHPAPLDPNFTGTGRLLTGPDGSYRFTTIKPGAYPWRNHDNAWRPAHIHFSLFGRAFPQRLVTQMYFPGDPLFDQDPIFNSIPDPLVRRRLVSRFDLGTTQPEWALGYRFDIVLAGNGRTPVEDEDEDDDD